jgi:glucosamine--fructose-6-phosphate aminotransferase (isomerizing)
LKKKSSYFQRQLLGEEFRKMCGIVGFVGNHQAAPILLDGLSKLEYRGYDSAGLAVRDGENLAQVVKAKGRLKELSEKTDNGRAVLGSCGIGHTRWATHGVPSQTNAHPHVSGNCTGSGSGKVESEVVGVHNGIIENYQELKEKLLKHGYTFYSQTDTEVVIKLIDYYYKKYNMGPVDALAKTMVRVRGSYALEVMFRDYPGEIWVARKDSPMIIGVKDGESYVASDVPAILKYTRNVYYIGNLEMAKLTAGEVHFFNLDGDEIQKELVEIKWDAEAAEKGGYEHFMIKEIHEQPKAVADTLNSVVANGMINLENVGLSDEVIKDISSITIVACGSAWHVGMVAQYVFEDLAKIPVRVELASEFRYRKPLLDKNQLVIVISQSGETADSLAALRLAKDKGIKTLGIVNVVGSSIAREADSVFYTLAGPEISVATTKAYSAQLMAAYSLALQFGKVRENVDEKVYEDMLAELQTIPQKIERILGDKERLQWFASKYANAKDVFFIGRGIDYAVSLEGSLKLKEISYIHSEAYVAGELKHGTISLIEDGTLVIGILTQSELYEKTVSNMVECKARGAYLMGVTTYGNYEIEDSVNFTTYIPKTDEHFSASLAVIPLQLLGYYVSVAKGLDVDKPRNLAKSVTVE